MAARLFAPAIPSLLRIVLLEIDVQMTKLDNWLCRFSFYSRQDLWISAWFHNRWIRNWILNWSWGIYWEIELNQKSGKKIILAIREEREKIPSHQNVKMNVCICWIYFNHKSYSQVGNKSLNVYRNEDFLWIWEYSRLVYISVGSKLQMKLNGECLIGGAVLWKASCDHASRTMLTMIS